MSITCKSINLINPLMVKRVDRGGCSYSEIADHANYRNNVSMEKFYFPERFVAAIIPAKRIEKTMIENAIYCPQIEMLVALIPNP